MHLSPCAVRNKKNFKNFGKSKKALARFRTTNVLNNRITPDLNPSPACTYAKFAPFFTPKFPLEFA